LGAKPVPIYCVKFGSKLRSRFMIHPAAGFLGDVIALAPFIGYAQFLYEAQLGGEQPTERLDVFVWSAAAAQMSPRRRPHTLALPSTMTAQYLRGPSQ
jgi:hypothetical protein